MESEKPPKVDKYKRAGKVFAVRLTDGERSALDLKEKQSRNLRGSTATRNKVSLGAFLVWAGLQWKPEQLELFPESPRAPRRKARPKKNPRPKAKKGKNRPRARKGKARPKPKKKGGRK